MTIKAESLAQPTSQVQNKAAATAGNSNKPERSNSKSSSSSSKSTTAAISKEDLWKNAEIKQLPENPGWQVEMTGLDSKTHTVYTRAVITTEFKDEVTHPKPTVLQVVDSVVDVAWKHVAKHILEQKDKAEERMRVDLDHWNQGAFPPPLQLLELGAVWLVNETSFLQHAGKKKHPHTKKKHPHTKKKRLSNPEDGALQPDWKDFVLRVHYAPNRYHAMEETDWNKYCRGLLLGDHSVQVWIGGTLLAAHDHVPLSGYPDAKDGAIVYEDAEHGFVVLNKPGTVPDHATVNNHAEDVLSVFSHVLQEREKEAIIIKPVQKENDPFYSHHHHRAAHLSLPLPLDTETQGLIIIATKQAFANYLTHMVEHPPNNVPTKATSQEQHNPPAVIHHGITKKYKCLVCVKTPEDMIVLNNLQESKAIITHYYHHNPNHKNHANFVTEIPPNQHPHEYGTCQMRLVKIGTNHGLYAANVTSDATVGDVKLAQRLWGLGVQNQSTTPAEDLGFSYVAQVEMEQIVDDEQLHTHLNKASRLTPQRMICGQVAALGFPIVGDTVHGGGTSEVWGHRHGWNRLALQCCEWSFPQPYWKVPRAGNNHNSKNDKNNGKKDTAEEAKDTGNKNDLAASKDDNNDEKKPVEEEKEKTSADLEEKKTEDTASNNATDVTNKSSNGKKTQSKAHPPKQQLLPSRDTLCVFRLNEAWWNPLLDQYHVEEAWWY